MPLLRGNDRATIRRNYLIERAHGKPRAQSWAIAYRQARRRRRRR